MNVIYITVRLLKAFQIEFSWYRLSSWINLTEQWPLRASLIVLEHDQAGDSFDDLTSLQSVYDKVRPKIACLREAATLLDLDRDERKLDAFLQLHKSDLLVSDLRIFLPFTINLDPYLRKVLKEDQQALEDEGIIIPVKSSIPPIKPHGFTSTRHMHQSMLHPTPQHPHNLSNWAGFYNSPPPPAAMAMMNYYNPNFANLLQAPDSGSNLKKSNHNSILIDHLNENHSMGGGVSSHPSKHHQFKQVTSPGSPPIDVDLSHVQLAKLSSEELIDVIGRVPDLKPTLDKMAPILRENAITGRVLTYCSLDELKSVLNLNFGHWEVFKMLITSLRDNPTGKKQPKTTTFAKGTNDGMESADGIPSSSSTSSSMAASQQLPQQSPGPSVFQPIRQKSQNVMEKQVTLEEQMICGALQTLNEDAFEDVVGSERPSPTGEMFSSQYLAPIRESSEIGSPPRLSYNFTNPNLHDHGHASSTNGGDDIFQHSHRSQLRSHSLHDESLSSVVIMPHFQGASATNVDDTKL